jgi:uncharacterized protein (TIGR00304 family)
MISIFLIAASIAFFIVGAFLGNVEIYLFLVFPIIKLNGIFGLIGILLLILGILLFFFSNFSNYQQGRISGIEREREKVSVSKDWGGIVFIGPVPIVFGNSSTRKRFPRWRYLLLIGIIFTVAIYLFLLMALAILT